MTAVETGSPSTAANSAPSLNRIVAYTVATGLVGVAAVAALDNALAPHDYWSTGWVWFVGVTALGILGEIVFVPLRRGVGWEQLTFNGAFVALAAMLVPPLYAIAASLLALIIVDTVLRRAPIKILFNAGAYASAASALLLIFLFFSGASSLFSVQSVAALLVGGIAFELVNLRILTMLWWALGEATPKETWATEWPLSTASGVFGVGLATVGVALGQTTPVLTPFALLPALALWYSYQTAARHSESRQRSASLVTFGQAVSTSATADEIVPKAAEALRRVFGAQIAQVRLPDGLVVVASENGSSAPLAAQDWPPALSNWGAQPRTLSPSELPRDWISGVAVRLDLGEEEPAGLVELGGLTPERSLGRLLPWLPRQWDLDEQDRPILAALVASLGSAIRAGATLSALRAEAAKLSAIVTNASDGICLLGPTGDFQLWSPAMTRITGIDAESALQLGAESPGLAALRSAISSTTQSGRIGLDWTDDQDQEHYLELGVEWFTQIGDQAPSAITTVRDVTEDRRAERLKSDFIATVSHELRTPITPIKGYAQLLLTKGDKVSPEKRDRILGQILERADHLARLVEDVLLASRVSEGTADRVRPTVAVENVDAVEMVRAAIAAVPELTGRTTVTLPTEPVLVSADPVRTGQCLTNLLTNAIKYSEQGSPIEVALTTSDERGALIAVRDHGIGIPSSEQDKIFRRFYRVEDPLTMTTGGNGLGLFIASELATAMGGRLTVDSTPGEGSVFTLELQPPTRDESIPPATLNSERESM